MINLDFGVLIDRPMKDVFTFVSNPNNMSKWNSAVVSLEQVSSGAVGVGSKFKTVGEMMGRRIEGEMQITAHEPDTKCGFQVNAGPMQVNLTLSFKTVGTGTKVSLNAQGNPGGIFKLAEGVMTGQIKSMMEGNLARLKDALEKGA
ncbi:MAG: SRPBCC family protein [Anaerolineales bacterium]|jgi:carbon monoxide dehydrogenase subunit G|uniref:SRPBCC family protein n=1 Tax=Candidatus Villigracilis vicinus TaxID=3140679 RepID=UPI0031363A54|nr:SRPBCC family protein [Anaerolineales bacterium]MBK7448414.1 SRPBCC family protein [Anaerolineales bacterium]MBK9781032.1 SRPBCC family protein [Anaerolineales bacterium]